jgi:hypothetical protein
MNRINYKIGDEIGSCIYLKELERKVYITKNGISKYRSGLFKCKCGKEFECRIDKIKREEVKSCGCLQKEAMKIIGINKITHGESYNPIFTVWRSIKDRCENVNNIGYYLYGGRGIKLCEKWQDVNNFINDMQPSYRKGLQIDRIDNDGDYEPSNCRWATSKQNSNNRRSNKIIKYNNEKRNIKQWSELLNIPYWRLQHKLIVMSVDDAFKYCLNYK